MSPILLGILDQSGVAVAGGSYESIATTTLTGTQSSVTFTESAGAWSSYRHLQLRGLVRTNRSAVEDQVRIRFNSDTSTNYSWNWLIGTGGAASAQTGTSTASAWTIEATGNTAAANSFGMFIVDILDFKSTSKNKTVKILSGYDANSSGTFILGSNMWFKTPEAITSFELAPIFGTNLLANSTFALYGIKES